LVTLIFAIWGSGRFGREACKCPGYSIRAAQAKAEWTALPH